MWLSGSEESAVQGEWERRAVQQGAPGATMSLCPLKYTNRMIPCQVLFPPKHTKNHPSKKNTRKFLEMMAMFSNLVAVTVSGVGLWPKLTRMCRLNM